mgnify:CR=1 FL=1
MKRTNPVGPAAHRGTSSETGIAHGLLNPKASIEECVSAAREQYNSLTALSQDPRIAKERDAIPGFVQMGLKELRDRKSTRLNSSHIPLSRMPSSA